MFWSSKIYLNSEPNCNEPTEGNWYICVLCTYWRKLVYFDDFELLKQPGIVLNFESAVLLCVTEIMHPIPEYFSRFKNQKSWKFWPIPGYFSSTKFWDFFPTCTIIFIYTLIQETRVLTFINDSQIWTPRFFLKLLDMLRSAVKAKSLEMDQNSSFLSSCL